MQTAVPYKREREMSDWLKADEAEGSFSVLKVLESAAACLMFPIMFCFWWWANESGSLQKIEK